MTNSFKTPIQKYLETLDELEIPPPDTEFAKTGFPQLDKSITGYRKGKLTILTGDHGIGVTSFILNSILQLESAGINSIIFYSLDHSIDIILKKLISIKSGIIFDKLKANTLKHYEITKIRKEIIDLENIISNIDDCMYQSTDKLKQDIKKHIEKPHVIFIDSIQSLIFDQDVYENDSDERCQTNETIDALIKLAEELNIPIVAVSKIPIKHGFDFGHNMKYLEFYRKRRTCEEDAHEIIAMFRPDYYGFNIDENFDSMEGQAQMCLIKNVTGKGRFIDFQIDFKYRKIT